MVDYANEIYCEIHPDEQCSPGNFKKKEIIKLNKILFEKLYVFINNIKL